MMDQTEFIDKVAAMRNAQKEYFKYRSKEALQRSKHLERDVDTMLLELKEGAKVSHLGIIGQGQLPFDKDHAF